ncbi:MAG: ATP-binding protein [Acidimicrobiia bacterium]|nr:ATP-binding protein [Acidimicrobiia bacterium]
MTLRARLSLFVGLAVAIAVAAVAGAAYVSATREARGEVEEFLVQRAGLLATVSDLSSRFPDPRMMAGRRLGGVAELFATDSIVQAFDHEGDLVFAFEGEPILPVNDARGVLAAGPGHYRLDDVWVEDAHYMVIAVPLSKDLALQIARDLSETDAIVAGLRLRLFGIGGLGVILAALMGWLVAGRALKPVGELTATAEHVATTQDFDAPIEVKRTDEIGRLASSFNTMLKALGASRQQQQQLVADASHELRTPLTSLRTNIELLAKSEDMEGAEKQELLADVTFELGELTELVSELVELATDARITHEPVSRVDLTDLVEQVAERARRRTGRTITVTGDGATVEGRPGMLERAVINLVDNAHKWSPPGVPIEVSVEGGTVEVIDHGPGIAMEDRSYVFERFYRSATARSMPGSGLGLAIVKQVIDLHGGQVWAKETPGGGARVGFQIPATL